MAAKGSKVQFDLQTFLSEMRQEQRSDHATVLSKVDSIDKKLDQAKAELEHHETRIVVVENTRKTIRWLAGTLVVAVLGAMCDFFFVHLPKLMAAAIK